MKGLCSFISEPRSEKGKSYGACPVLSTSKASSSKALGQASRVPLPDGIILVCLPQQNVKKKEHMPTGRHI